MYFYIVTTDNMKIFSTFDTQSKQKALREQKERYGDDKVHLLEKSNFFFIKHIIGPFFSIIFSALLSGYIVSEFFKITPIITGSVIIAVMILWILYADIIKHYIDYKMDYCIITPDEIILTEQSWLFNRWIKTLDAAKVKSISVQKKNMIHSLFNNGDIIFMSDGDDTLWEIVLDYIHNPEWQKNILHNIIIKE